MVVLLSPTKTMANQRIPNSSPLHSKPIFEKHAERINRQLAEKDRNELISLLKISEKLSHIVVENLNNFHCDHMCNPALFSYEGTVFREIAPHSLNREEQLFAHKYLRILSAYYGLLSPLDSIRPYRLEMKTALVIDHRKNLYDFWKSQITDELNRQLDKRNPTVLNLASQEYFRVIDKRKLNARIVQVDFKEITSSGYKTIGIYAKKARGKMVNSILKRQISIVDEIKEISFDGYSYDSGQSSESHWIYSRK